MRWEKHEARMVQTRNEFNVLVGKYQWKMPVSKVDIDGTDIEI
jgi:hypothetical protein